MRARAAPILHLNGSRKWPAILQQITGSRLSLPWGMQKAEYVTTDTTVLSASQNASPFIAFFFFIFNSNGICWTANAVACCIFPHSWSYIFIPSCKNNLFIPFLSPAWDGSHFPHSLWFYHNCLPTYVLCLSCRVFLLQKAAKQFSPAAEKWWSVQKSLCAELIASLPTHFRESSIVL